MAKVNVLAKFLSQALEWKARFPQSVFYAGLRYPTFIFPWSRRIFPTYNRLYPDDEEFTKRFVRDLRSKDPQLQKLINPDTVTPEQVTLTEQFDREAPVEQAQVAAIIPAAEAAPATAATPGGLRLPLSAALTAQGLSVTQTPPSQSEVASQATLPEPFTKAFAGAPDYMLNPSIPKPISATGKSLASKTGIFFKKNIGKYLTVGNIGTVVSGGAGLMAGLGLTGGNPLGGLMGGIGGVAGRFWIGGGGGGQFLGKLGSGIVNFGVGLSNQMSTGSLIKLPSGRVGLLLLGSLLLLIFATGFIGAIPSGQPSPPPSPTTYAPGAGSGIISCPLNGAVTITNGSKDTGGHCSISYETAYGVCTKPGSTGYTGRDTALDVTSSDRMVYLPRVQGAVQAKWIVDEAGNVPITEGEGGGLSVAAHTTVNNKTYRIRFVHIESTNLKIGDTVDAGTAVGQYYLHNPYGAHVHITMQEDGVFKPADSYFNLCR